MASFEEPFIRDIIWRWLGQQKQYDRIGGEVSVSNGRIDIVAETQDGQYHGFEIKSINGNISQVVSYVKSGYLDKVYFGSGFTDPFVKQLNSKKESRIGVIEAPIWGHGWDPTEVEEIINKVEIKSNAEKISRKEKPEFDWTDESFIDYHVWRTNGILREAQISNSSYQSKQIDIVDVAERPVPKNLFEQPSEYSYIGIEAKGASSFSPSSVTDQLEEYIDCGCFSKYYLAVPTNIADRALKTLENAGLGQVGLMSVSEVGSVNTVKPAEVTDIERPEWHPFNDSNPTAFRVGADQDEVSDPTNPELVPHEIESWMEPGSNDWVTRGGNYFRQNRTALPSFTEVDTIQKYWSHDTGSGRILAPTRVNGTVFAANRHGRLYGIDAETGVRKWEHSYLNKIRTSPTLTEGLAIVTSGRDLVACRLSDGGKVWQVGGRSSDYWMNQNSDESNEGKPYAAPVVIDDRVVAVWEKDKICCISAQSGEVEWKTNIDAGIQKPLITNGEQVVAIDWDTVHAFNIATGEKIWEKKTEAHMQNAIADGNSIFLLTNSSLIKCGWNGEEQWVESTNFDSPLAGDQNNLYAVHNSMGFCEISKSNGEIEPILNRDIEDQIKICQNLSISAGNAFIHSYDPFNETESITVVNLLESDESYCLNIDEDLHSTFAFGENKLYSGTKDGKIICYRVN